MGSVLGTTFFYSHDVVHGNRRKVDPTMDKTDIDKYAHWCKGSIEFNELI